MAHPDKLKDWAKICNFELDFDHIRPWTVKDHGLGHRDYCHIDALRYDIEFLCKYEGKWKGEQKMGITLDSIVNGGLYYKDNDGNFVKLMTVTNIETDYPCCSTYKPWDIKDPGITEIKVSGHTVSEAEKEEAPDTGKRRMLGSISEKYSLDDHVFFMIFDGTTFSVKIDRTFIGLSPNYNMPYRVTVYDAGHILWAMTYQTWHDLECTFMYNVGAVLNASFSPVSTKYTISRMLRGARRVVKCNVPEELDEMKTVLNRMYGYGKAVPDTFFNKDLPTAANIEKVIFDAPATVILWKDGTRTVVHAQNGEHYDKEKGFAMAVCKKIFGNERDYYHVFKRWFRKGEDRTAKEMERRRNEL